MAGFKEYDRYDALGLAELIRKKEISPQELCEEAISRIDRINPKLNAVIYRMYDIAHKTLKGRLPEGPFHRRAFSPERPAHLLCGRSLTMGSRAYQYYVPMHDSELMKRTRPPGWLSWARPTLRNSAWWGIPSRNCTALPQPWNLDHTPAAPAEARGAAVASGMVPMASGGDGGGSIRIPASCCALFGLKPTRGRVPTGPEYGEIWQGAAVEHVITRSVRDSAAMLDAIRRGRSGRTVRHRRTGAAVPGRSRTGSGS